MTLARIKSTGRGKIEARVAVDGWPYEFVTSRALERTAADGRVRIRGLRLDTLRKSARADLMRASLRAEGFSVVVEDVTRANRATLALGKRPALTTWLTPAGASVTDTTTPLLCADTTGWPASGYAHVGTEAFSYSGLTATSFTGCARGIWGTVAQYHFAPDGAGLSYPRITEIPQSLEGRRVRVYLYGDGDDKQGDGTLEVFGTASTDRKYADGAWTFAVDPITRLLDQEVGGDLEADVPIRGIYYPWNAPLWIGLTADNIGRSAMVRVKGFFADQYAFCVAVTAAIATAVSGWPWAAGSSITAQVVDASSAWALVYTVGTGPGTVADVTLGSVAARSMSDLDAFEAAMWRGDDGVPVSPSAGFVAGRVYRQLITATVPRAAVGGPSPRERGIESAGLEPDETAASIRRVYLGGLVVPTSDMSVVMTDPEAGPLNVNGSSVGDRYIKVATGFRILGSATRLKFGRGIGTGSIEAFRATLVAQSHTVANAGAMPLITGTDWEYGADAVEASAGTRIGNRRFSFFQGVKMREVVEAELRAIGCYMRLSASGAMQISRVRPVLATDSSVMTFDESTIIGRPKVERAAWGYIASVIYRTGYDPIEDEWSGSVQVRDVAITSPTRIAAELEIAQKSLAIEGDPPPDAVARAAMPILGLFGGPYDVVTLEVSYRAMSIRIGDACLITHPLMPNAEGTLGVVAYPGMVTGYDFRLDSGGGSVEILVHGQRFAGYAPGFRVASQALVAGNTWDITLTLTGYTDATAIATILAVSDLIRVTEQDTATPAEVSGTVDSFQSATVVRVTFGAAWTPGIVEWCLRARASTAYVDVTTGLGRYAYVAESTRRVDYLTTDADAREWAA